MLRRKLYRDLWHYKGQFFTIFLMVFIGMLAFSGIHGYMDGMDESAKEYYKEYNLQDLWITNTNVSDSDLNDLKSLDHVRVSSYLIIIINTITDIRITGLSIRSSQFQHG